MVSILDNPKGYTEVEEAQIEEDAGQYIEVTPSHTGDYKYTDIEVMTEKIREPENIRFEIS